jgi:hypothetical protein
MVGEGTEVIPAIVVPTLPKLIVEELRKRDLLGHATVDDYLKFPEYRIAAAVSVFKENPADEERAWTAAAIAAGVYSARTKEQAAYFTMCRNGEIDPIEVYTRIAERAQPYLTPGWRKTIVRKSAQVPGR